MTGIFFENFNKINEWERLWNFIFEEIEKI